MVIALPYTRWCGQKRKQMPLCPVYCRYLAISRLLLSTGCCEKSGYWASTSGASSRHHRWTPPPRPHSMTVHPRRPDPRRRRQGAGVPTSWSTRRDTCGSGVRTRIASSDACLYSTGTKTRCDTTTTTKTTCVFCLFILILFVMSRFTKFFLQVTVKSSIVYSIANKTTPTSLYQASPRCTSWTF